MKENLERRIAKLEDNLTDETGRLRERVMVYIPDNGRDGDRIGNAGGNIVI